MLKNVFSHTVAQGNCEPSNFFLLPSWWHYLYPNRVTFNNISRTCEFNVQLMNNGRLDLTSLTLIALGILDILLRLGGLVAVGFIVYGGVQYVLSQGQPDKTKQATGTIVNALIGLIITIIAAAAVRFIGSAIGS